jgi:hypothetical protein
MKKHIRTQSKQITPSNFNNSSNDNFSEKLHHLTK